MDNDLGPTVQVSRALARKVEAFLHAMVNGLADEGDRVYLESTNQADDLRALSEEVTFAMYDIMAQADNG